MLKANTELRSHVEENNEYLYNKTTNNLSSEDYVIHNYMSYISLFCVSF